ncbi:hypothetical protein [Xenorhabdus thailandensis]|uniref:hypothetical protein n=1 Tax=Xenorhabdus thailandensis TaxID=3136255 RepID=UPI0030F4A071
MSAAQTIPVIETKRLPLRNTKTTKAINIAEHFYSLFIACSSPERFRMCTKTLLLEQAI